MGELLWAGLIALGLGALAIIQIVPWYTLVEVGYQLMLRAAAVGIPLELLYFALMWQALRRDGPAPRGWYWRSFVHHPLLDRGQRQRVLPWFYLGALAFAAISLGITLVLLGFVAAARQG